MNNFNSYYFNQTTLKELKFEHKEILAVLKIVFLHENTNLSEKKNE